MVNQLKEGEKLCDHCKYAWITSTGIFLQCGEGEVLNDDESCYGFATEADRG
jgi:hypothetical protein